MFTERIKFLDRKIHPGLVKLTWASRAVAELFVQDCRQHASKVQMAEIQSGFQLCVGRLHSRVVLCGVLCIMQLKLTQ